MNQEKFNRNKDIISRYMCQPEVMPQGIRQRIEADWDGKPVQLYALADLDASLNISRTWLALGPDHVAVVRVKDAKGNGSGNGKPPTGGEGIPGKEAFKRTSDNHTTDSDTPSESQLEVVSFARSRVKEVRETPSLSCNTLTILGEPDEPALAVVRYSYRQQGAIGNIVFILKQAIEGNAIPISGEAGNADEIYAEAVSEPVLKAQSSVVKHKLSVFARLLQFLIPYKKRFTLGMLASMVVTGISLIPPYLTKYLVDNVLTPFNEGKVDPLSALNTGWVILGIIVCVYLTRELFLWYRLRTMTIVGELVARDLRTKLYNHLQRLSVSYFSRHQTGSIISRVSSDTDRIWDFVAFGVAEITISTLMLIGLSAMLLSLDWQLGLILIMPVPLIFFFIYMMGRRLHRIFMRIWQKWSNMTAVLSDTIPGIRVVKAFNQEDYERERFRQRNYEVTAEAVHISKVWSTNWPLIFLGLEAMTVLVWFFALPRMLGVTAAGEVTLTTGTFIAFLLYMGMFIHPIEAFGFLTRMINRSLSSAHRVFEVLDTEPEVIVQEDPKRLEPIQGKISFEDVTFGYDAVRLILKGISFEVQPGEMIGLVGPSGAGKTTVINLIARFFDANSGCIRIDDVDVKELDIGHYRKQIGMVMQDPYLFHGSVLDNIRYGHHEASVEEVIAAAKAANAHDFICKLPNGYDTIVGERGHTLSGGERQRVSIARAILHNPRILILDEATSSVDTETERKIQEAIDRLISGRTVIAIAHRLSTLRQASRLFVLKDGKMVEQGTHEELLAKEDGLYRKLQNMQRELHEMYAV